MRTTLLALAAGVAHAIDHNGHLRRQTNTTDTIKCPVIFDGRIPKNLTLQSFNTASTSPFNPDYVKGVNLTWSDILLLPSASNTTIPPSRFDTQSHQPLEVTVDSRSIFRAGENLQPGFRRAGLLLKDDANDPFADRADNGSATFHWSMRLDAQRPFNLSHEYMNVWHEKADYSGNQFTFVGGRVLDGDGGEGVNWSEGEKAMWRVQDSSLKFVYNVSMVEDQWQNFGIKLDYTNSTIQVFYSEADAPLQAVTDPLPNNNTGGGQLQIGIAKKPTETETVVFDGYHEYIPIRGEGQIYGGIFVEDSTDGCVSL